MADVKISDLPAGSSLGGSELVEAVQGGVNVKVTLGGVRDYIFTGVSALAFALLADQEPEDMRDTLGAAAEQHEHDIDDVDGLPAALSSKISASEKAAANGVATLGGDGKIPSAQLPPVAITETFVVNSQAAMLALDAQEGDVAVRTDLSKSYILQSEPASELENWQELLTPSDVVISVNGQTGAVSLTYTDVGAQQASDMLSAIAALTPSSSGFLVGNGSTWTVLTGSSVRSAAGLGSMAVQNSSSVTITGGSIAQAAVTGLEAALDAKAPLASPALTGNPTAPTQPAGNNSTRLATTAFVATAIANLINSAPGALDTLAELAAALGGDANFATTVTNALAGKQPLDATLTALAGQSVSANQIIYATGADSFSTTALTAFARTILDDADAVAVRTTISAETLGELSGINTRTANYTLVLADKGKTVEMNLAGANTLTVPPNSSVAFPVGSYINVVQLGAGATTIVAGSGVTILCRNTLVLAGQYAMATLYKRATNEWVLGGDLTP